nr:uncharacterized protein LOC111855603 [Paramormyrops kingsleyae]
MVCATLNSKPGGDKILNEYDKTKSLSDSTRRQLVNILVADMVEIHGRVPPQNVRIKYAQGIVALFPYLEDPFSKNGYEHFYDPASGSGYLAWRLKTVQRNTTMNLKSGKPAPEYGGPQVQRSPVTTQQQLTGDECREAISILNHSSDQTVVREKMKATFEYRQNLVHDADKSTDILDTFPRFLDTVGLIEQDFIMMFGEETAGKFLAKWPTFFRPRVLEQSKGLVLNAHVEDLIKSAQGESDSGHKKTAKISTLQAEDYFLRFLQVGASIQTFLSDIEPSQPFLLCIGEHKKRIQNFYVILDNKAVPCKARTSVAAFDELFKAHFVFSTAYSQVLDSFYVFIQTAVYNIDVGVMKEKPRVKELRARFLHTKT